MNSGERNELLIKLYLILMRDNRTKFNNSLITSVGFGGFEYKSIPMGTHSNFDSLNDIQLINLANNVVIKKAGTFDKSDVYINYEGYSIKYFSAAPPALVNHTARPGFEMACNTMGVNIQNLDNLVDKYWELRLNGIIKEDIKNSDINSPFKNSKHILKPILEYFLFIGSGKGHSKHPAKYILDCTEPSNFNTWHIITHNTAVDVVWDRLIFSVRAKKGMPKDYDKKTYSKSNAKSICRWTQYCNDHYRGELHIRTHK